MKKIIALILALAMTFSVAGAYWFDDTKYSKNQEAIELLYELGIIEGYGNREFGPKDNLTRAQACALLVRALVPDHDIYKSYDENFVDVNYNDWYRIYVDTAYRNDYVNGYGNGQFGPQDKVTYAQFATMLTNILGYEANKLSDKWPNNVLNVAHSLDMFTNTSIVNYLPNDAITREDAAQMIYNAMDCAMVTIVGGEFVKTGVRFMDKIITDYTYTLEGTVVYVAQSGGVITNRYIANYWIVDATGVVHEIYGASRNVISVGEYVIITYDFSGNVVDMVNYSVEEDTVDLYVDDTDNNFRPSSATVYHIDPDCEILVDCEVLHLELEEIPSYWVACDKCKNN